MGDVSQRDSVPVVATSPENNVKIVNLWLKRRQVFRSFPNFPISRKEARVKSGGAKL
jgi:hypothetical protein